jgi:hypothetical protein
MVSSRSRKQETRSRRGRKQEARDKEARKKRQEVRNERWQGKVPAFFFLHNITLGFGEAKKGN